MFKFKIDIPLFIGLMILCSVSLFILWSAGGESQRLLFNQSVRMGVAILAMLAIAQVRPETLFRVSPVLFGIGLVMLLLVLLVGYTGKGAQRWLDLGFMRFQPSELMKIAVPMMVSWVLTRKPLPPSAGNLSLATAVLVAPAILILKQLILKTLTMEF